MTCDLMIHLKMMYPVLGEGKEMDSGLFGCFYRIRELFHCTCTSLSVNH